IKSANDLFKVEKKGLETNIIYDDSLKAYCPIPKNLNNKECVHYEAIVSSAFIALLTLFKNGDDDDEEEDCEAIKSANDLFKVEKKGLETNIIYDDSLKAYCPIPKNLNNKECVHYEAIVSSAFIALLTLFKNGDDDDEEEDVLEDDKLAEYAILWLCYKIDQGTYKYSNLSAFYKKYIMDIEKDF
ncbi:Plasmodium variant antigen protein Cir/Yir/Bir, putative, partial [Plasmodium chabaudi chabaudi]